MYLQMFHRQLIHFGIGVYRKITKIKCTTIGDDVINCVEFCRVVSRFLLA